jgi:putative transposase
MFTPNLVLSSRWKRLFSRNPTRTRDLEQRHLHQLFVTIQRRPQYLWRAVDEDGDVIDILVQSRRNRRAAARFFRRLLNRQGCVPRRLIIDKLRSYSAARVR